MRLSQARAKAAAERAAEGRKQREHAARCEAGRRPATLESTRRHLRRIQADIQAAAASIQNPKELKDTVVKLYHTHVTEEQSGANVADSQEQHVAAVAGEDMYVCLFLALSFSSKLQINNVIICFRMIYPLLYISHYTVHYIPGRLST